MLYEDGMALRTDWRENKKETYFDFVKYIYKEAGDNNFFDEFIKSNYKREILVWHHMTTRELTNEMQIIEILKKMDFDQFGADHDHGINFTEFWQFFKNSRYSVDPG